MRLKLISCEIFFRELCACVARSPHIIDFEFLPKGLHDIGCEEMRARLQAVVDRVEERQYDALLLGYGLCNNGIVGLTTKSIPMVVPRGHDCITVFLGSAARYMDYFNAHPGVYFKTTGWIERGEADGELGQLALGKKLGLKQSYEEMVAKYGEENASTCGKSSARTWPGTMAKSPLSRWASNPTAASSSARATKRPSAAGLSKSRRRHQPDPAPGERRMGPEGIPGGPTRPPHRGELRRRRH